MSGDRIKALALLNANYIATPFEIILCGLWRFIGCVDTMLIPTKAIVD
ncbi:MAG: hypothetical protein WBF90_27435 [Rivularia sp. (in: cyanobacteria)]